MISTLPRSVKYAQKVKLTKIMRNSVSSSLQETAAQSTADDLANLLQSLSTDDPEGSAKPLKQTKKSNQQELIRKVWLSKVKHAEKCDLAQILYREQAVFFDWPLRGLQTTDLNSTNRFAAIDCEMIATVRSKNYPARISLVDYYGVVLMDVYIRPNSKVTSYRTKWSGVSPGVLQRAQNQHNLLTLEHALEILQGHLNKNKYMLIGHGINNDFSALRWRVPENKYLDTQNLDFFQREAGGCGLKKVLWHYFNIVIQAGSHGHDSVEDARASMLIFRTFESLFRAKYKLGGNLICNAFDWHNACKSQ